MEQDEESLPSESEVEESQPLDGLFFAESLLDLSSDAMPMLGVQKFNKSCLMFSCWNFFPS